MSLFPIISPGADENNFQNIAVAAGITPQLTYDVGSSISVAVGSQQNIDDLANANDAWRGTTSGAQASDPTFNGTPGNLTSSEYYSFDGGDRITLQSQPAFIEEFHKDNALLFAIGWVSVASLSATHQFFDTRDTSGTEVGCNFQCVAADTLQFLVRDGGSNALAAVSTFTMTAGQNACVGVKLDEAAGTGEFFLDGSFNSFTSTYVTPSAASSSGVLTFGARGDGTTPLPNNSRIYGFVLGNTYPSDAEFTAFYDASKGRFGL